MGKKGTSMILCFYRKEVETFKEKHKIIDVPNSPTYAWCLINASSILKWGIYFLSIPKKIKMICKVRHNKLFLLL
jgi:hypothetical protein